MESKENTQQDFSLVVDDGPFTPKKLITSTLPDEFLHAAQVDFRSKQRIKYTSVFTYDENSNSQLYLFPQIDLDLLDFTNTQGLILQIVKKTKARPIETRTNAFSRNCDLTAFLLGDSISYSRVISLNRNFTQKSIGYFAQSCAQVFTDIIIQQLVYQNLPKEYWQEISAIELEKI